MTVEYDAIVVGARCAGSPTAMLLARKGYRVLLVDRATFPSDTLSTLSSTRPALRRCAAGVCSTGSLRPAARRSRDPASTSGRSRSAERRRRWTA